MILILLLHLKFLPDKYNNSYIGSCIIIKKNIKFYSKANYMFSRSIQINMFHVAMVGPILYYIGNKGKNANSYAFTALATLAIAILFFVRKPNLETYRGIIRMFHYLLYIPIFLFISYQNTNLPDWAFIMIKYLGISVSAIHFYLLFRQNKV